MNVKFTTNIVKEGVTGAVNKTALSFVSELSISSDVNNDFDASTMNMAELTITSGDAIDFNVQDNFNITDLSKLKSLTIFFDSSDITLVGNNSINFDLLIEDGASSITLSQTFVNLLNLTSNSANFTINSITIPAAKTISLYIVITLSS